jgi:nucleotide-binding universal stress UspA family protein
MLPRFKHLLIPLDFTKKNLTALDVAFELASQNRARTTLLHVVERIPTAGSGDEDPDLAAFYERLQARATTDLESMSQRFAEAGLEVEYKVWVGQRVPEIVRFVAERAVDLVVLSSHRIDPGHPVQSLATMSYQLSILCPCPVLLVK